ncbi:MAG: hypothetical protein V4773_13445 [Verrucomicrobiota bacterium]
MHRFPLVLCALALASCVVSGVLFFKIGNSKQVLESRLTDATTRATHLESSLATANEQNGALKSQRLAANAALSETHTQLRETRTQLTAAESRVAQAATDLAQTKAVLELYEQTARALSTEVATLRQDIEDIRATHASPETIEAYRTVVAELEKQLATARTAPAAPNPAAASTAVLTNRAGRATILTVGPESSFVVLNFGSARGARLGHKLIVSQGTAEVATVTISDVRTNFSVAQVTPATLRGPLQKGDIAVLQQ